MVATTPRIALAGGPRALYTGAKKRPVRYMDAQERPVRYAASAMQYPSASNTFSISFESTGMVVSATRDPNQFSLPKYMQYVGVTKRTFRYLQLDLDEPARIVTSQEFAWAPGQAAPTQNNIGAFQYVDNTTTKYAYAWTLPMEDIDQAEWNIESSQIGIIMQKAMTNRVILTSTLVQTASNWPSANTATVNTLNGGAGPWNTASSDPASAYYLAIKKSLVKACTTIVLQTNAVMKWRDVRLIASPNLLNAMGNSSEVFDYVKYGPDAFERQKGAEVQIGEYGMPAKYIVDLIAEDAVRVTTRPNVSTGIGTTGTRGFVWQDSTPVLLSRKGGVTGQYGGTALSTVQLYAYREMEVWSKTDSDNELELGRCVDDISIVLPFGQSGYCIQNAV